MKLNYWFVTLFIFSFLNSGAQVIDNFASSHNINSQKYIRIHYENDYFSQSDEFYTQGVNFEFVHPKLSKIPLFIILPKLRSTTFKYGLSLEHIGYTPTSISSADILVGDRPFAALLFLKTFSIQTDTIKKFRLSSIISTGIIGPVAGGKQIQSSIHQWIGDQIPQGWEHQIRNDLILNYQFDIEKKIISWNDNFSFSAKSGAMIGTMDDKAYAGLVLMSGLFNDPFKNSRIDRHPFQIYLYLEPKLNLVGYNASLQGGVFNRSSPYIIRAKDINRIIYQHNYGIVVKFKKLNVEYFQSMITEEFLNQGKHHWGGIRLAYEY